MPSRWWIPLILLIAAAVPAARVAAQSPPAASPAAPPAAPLPSPPASLPEGKAFYSPRNPANAVPAVPLKMPDAGKVEPPGSRMFFARNGSVAPERPPYTPPAGATYYASPGGTGDGSPGRPMTIRRFWAVAKPGDRLLLLPGTYTGEDSMIQPPRSLGGLPGLPITVAAQADGTVRIDGEGRFAPVALSHNFWIVLEGFDACRSSVTVVSLSNATNCVVRRVAAWDAAEGNHTVFGVHYSRETLIEDCAGWGVGRKIFTCSQRGDYTIFRRCWGRWEGSHVVGPKMVFSLAYNSYHNRFEQCVGTWDARRMQQAYMLMGYDGRPYVDRTGRTPTFAHFAVDQPYGIFGVDGFTGDSPRDAHTAAVGCVAYVLAEQRMDGFAGGFFATRLNHMELRDCVSVIQRPGAGPFVLDDGPAGKDAGNRAENLTAVGRKPSAIDPGWAGSGLTGAAQPMQAWPMNARIKSACGVDVEADLRQVADIIRLDTCPIGPDGAR